MLFRNNIKKDKTEYIGDTIYLTKKYDVDIETLLSIIVGNIENFVRQKGIMPNKLKLSNENYERILRHNKTLIDKKNEKIYTFGVEIELWNM